MTGERSDPPQTLREEAAAWFARMRGDDADLYRAEFERWLSRGALHRAAYNRVGEIFAAGKMLKHPAAADRARSGRPPLRPLVTLGVAVIAASGLLAAYLADQAPSAAPGSAAQRSPRLARDARVLELDAGARALLDIDGMVSQKIDGPVRIARLDQGRARFTVPAGRDHVFLAGGMEVRSRGGVFDLWMRRDGSLMTSVLTGAVRLAPTLTTGFAGSSTRIFTVLAGEACLSDPIGRSAPIRARAGTLWPSGVLEFRGAMLAEVLEEANRYSAIKITIVDRSLAERRLTGRIAISDARRLARQVAAALSLEVDERHSGTIVLRMPR